MPKIHPTSPKICTTGKYRAKNSMKTARILIAYTSGAFAGCVCCRMAALRLLARLMPVPVMGMVARWTRNTANPIGSRARICRRSTHNK